MTAPTPHPPLPEQLKTARQYYGASVDFSQVTVKPSAVFVGKGKGMAWACNNVVRFQKTADGSHGLYTSTLIHELGHVWEHQSGQLQLIMGIVEQVARALSFGRYDPYDYGAAAGLKQVRQFQQLSKESQAQILEEYWKATNGHRVDRLRRPFTPEYLAEMERLIQSAGIGKTVPRPRRSLLWVLDRGLAAVVNAIVDLLDNILARLE